MRRRRMPGWRAAAPDPQRRHGPPGAVGGTTYDQDGGMRRWCLTTRGGVRLGDQFCDTFFGRV